MELSTFIKVYDNFLQEKTCENIIKTYNDNLEHVDVYDTEGYKFHQLNLNKNHLFDLASSIANSLVPYYNRYFEEVGYKQFVDIKGFEEVRIKKYIKNSNDEFKTHVDVVDKQSAVRYCIAIVYLNDNDGCTTFPKLGLKIEPKAGRLIIFPPMWMFPHNGLTPTDADKYIMMTSLHYS